MIRRISTGTKTRILTGNEAQIGCSELYNNSMLLVCGIISSHIKDAHHLPTLTAAASTEGCLEVW